MWLGLAGLCAAVLSLAGIFLYLDPQIPRPETYRNVQLETPLRVYANNGALLAEFGERRLIPISLDQVPEHFVNALLDTEDKRFYEHSGIDFISLTNDALGLLGTFVTEGELANIVAARRCRAASRRGAHRSFYFIRLGDDGCQTASVYSSNS